MEASVYAVRRAEYGESLDALIDHPVVAVSTFSCDVDPGEVLDLFSRFEMTVFPSAVFERVKRIEWGDQA